MGNIATGERLEFYDFSDVTVEHLHRYAIAKDFVSGKVVLDIASGEGYGSYILSDLALEVIGVDIDNESVQNAKDKYSKDNLKYLLGSADNIPVESNSIDVVVSFETIEHHDKHEEMFLELKRVLKHDGILIMSSPDKKYYSELTGQVNPFHVKELYFKEFKTLIDQFFQFTNYYFQNSFNLSSFVGDFESFNNYIIYSGDEQIINKSPISPVYNIVIASEAKSYDICNSFFNGFDISKRLNEKFETELNKSLTMKWKKSNTFRIGNLIVFPIFMIKRKLKRFFL